MFEEVPEPGGIIRCEGRVFSRNPGGGLVEGPEVRRDVLANLSQGQRGDKCRKPINFARIGKPRRVDQMIYQNRNFRGQVGTAANEAEENEKEVPDGSLTG